MGLAEHTLEGGSHMTHRRDFLHELSNLSFLFSLPEGWLDLVKKRAQSSTAPLWLHARLKPNL